MAIMEFQQVGKWFNNGEETVTALEGIDLSMEEGEFLSVIGPSGCGKSTLLYLAGGFSDASSGTVRLDGNPITGPGADRGMVFQNYSLFPWLTVRENVRYSLGLKRHRHWYRPVNEALGRSHYADHLVEVMGLGQFRDHYPRQLSGGMQQRVAIARTLAAKPRVVLMDEPFSALDAQTREEMQELLFLLRSVTRITVFFVTHDVEEAVYLSDRVVVLSRRPGNILTDSTISIPGRPDLAIKHGTDFLKTKNEFTDLIRSQCERQFDREVFLDLLQNQTK